MLAADTYVKVRVNRFAEFDSHLHQLANANLIQFCKWIAKEADFFCFGTNDLTQMTYGFSRDDAGKFLEAYYDAKIFENDPFAKLDQTGVGKLMKMAIELGKPVNQSLHVGICGEHGGDPSSVEFCNEIGLDYVSCSPQIPT